MSKLCSCRARLACHEYVQAARNLQPGEPDAGCQHAAQMKIVPLFCARVCACLRSCCLPLLLAAASIWSIQVVVRANILMSQLPTQILYLYYYSSDSSSGSSGRRRRRGRSRCHLSGAKGVRCAALCYYLAPKAYRNVPALRLMSTIRAPSHRFVDKDALLLLGTLCAGDGACSCGIPCTAASPSEGSPQCTIVHST